MSTSFNPQAPTDTDSVYDAYFVFRQNMLSINNLLDVDHYNGTAPKHHGMHKQVSFPDPQDQDPTNLGNAGALYTKIENGSTRLKFASGDKNWNIPLGDFLPDSGNNQNPGPSYTDNQPLNWPLDMGTGHARFSNKLAIVWIRDSLLAGATTRYPFPLTFSRVFLVLSDHSDPGNSPYKFSFNQTNPHDTPAPDRTVLVDQIVFKNNSRHKNISIQAFVIGEAKS